MIYILGMRKIVGRSNVRKDNIDDEGKVREIKYYFKRRRRKDRETDERLGRKVSE